MRALAERTSGAKGLDYRAFFREITGAIFFVIAYARGISEWNLDDDESKVLSEKLDLCFRQLPGRKTAKWAKQLDAWAPWMSLTICLATIVFGKLQLERHATARVPAATDRDDSLVGAIDATGATAHRRPGGGHPGDPGPANSGGAPPATASDVPAGIAHADPEIDELFDVDVGL